jgi:hypothetical protein
MPPHSPRNTPPAGARNTPRGILGKLPVEARFVLTGLLGLAAITLGGATLTVGPWSPLSLERPAEALASGDAEAALKGYLSLADHPMAGAWNRRPAMWRAAQIAAVELRDPTQADALAARFLEIWPQAPERVQVLTLRASLNAGPLNRPELAAELWVSAAEAAPQDAGHHLLEAARISDRLDTEGSPSASTLALYERASRYPEQATAAYLALGRLRLPLDSAAAYEAYARALQASGASGEAATARLGMAAALERLEGREAAVALLEEGGEALDEDKPAGDRGEPKRVKP